LQSIAVDHLGVVRLFASDHLHHVPKPRGLRSDVAADLVLSALGGIETRPAIANVRCAKPALCHDDRKRAIAPSGQSALDPPGPGERRKAAADPLEEVD